LWALSACAGGYQKKISNCPGYIDGADKKSGSYAPYPVYHKTDNAQTAKKAVQNPRFTKTIGVRIKATNKNVSAW
jgi:hypothetical protein